MSRLTTYELDALRTDQEELLSDIGRFYEILSPSTLQPGGTFSVEDATITYEGPMSITPIVARRDRFDEFGEGLIYTLQYRVQCPYVATGIAITNRLEIIESEDPAIDLRNFEVRDVHYTSEISLRRVTLHDTAR
jgi:hypothetical protein